MSIEEKLEPTPEMQSKSLELSKNLPFSVETLLKEVGESAKRSRSILLLLIFTSLLVFMAMVNSSSIKTNWYKSKIELNKTAYQFIVFPKEKSESIYNNLSKVDTLKPIITLSQFIYNNERNIQKISSSIEIVPDSVIKRDIEIEAYDSLYPMEGYFRLQNPMLSPVLNSTFEKRKEIYKEIGMSINYIISETIDNEDIIKSTLIKFNDLKIEYLDLVRVPILGISFHVNLLGVYSGFILIVLYLLFLFSIFREHTNLKITFKRGWIDMKNHPYYLYEYASMQQVLSMPRKLFGATKKHRFDFLSIFVHYFAYIIYFPFLVYALVFINDIYTIPIGLQANPTLTKTTVIIDLAFSSIILYLCMKVRHRWEKMDVLWLNQSIEFNFQFILVSINDYDVRQMDAEKELTKLVTPLLNEDHTLKVKNLYYSTIQKVINKRTLVLPFFKKWQERKSKRRYLQLFESFLEKALSEEFAKSADNVSRKISQAYVDNYWNKLKDWYYVNGKKNVGSSFGETFKKMISELK